MKEKGIKKFNYNISNLLSYITFLALHLVLEEFNLSLQD